MKHFRFVFAFVILGLTAGLSYGQIKLNVDAAVSNLLRYGNGYEYSGTSRYGKEYFENLTDARLNVNGVIFECVTTSVIRENTEETSSG